MIFSPLSFFFFFFFFYTARALRIAFLYRFAVLNNIAECAMAENSQQVLDMNSDWLLQMMHGQISASQIRQEASAKLRTKVEKEKDHMTGTLISSHKSSIVSEKP